jgi:hypothetical protein
VRVTPHLKIINWRLAKIICIIHARHGSKAGSIGPESLVQLLPNARQLHENKWSPMSYALPAKMLSPHKLHAHEKPPELPLVTRGFFRHRRPLEGDGLLYSV